MFSKCPNLYICLQYASKKVGNLSSKAKLASNKNSKTWKEDCTLLGYEAMPCKLIVTVLTFWKSQLPPPTTCKQFGLLRPWRGWQKAPPQCRTTIYQLTRHHIPGDLNLPQDGWDSFKSGTPDTLLLYAAKTKSLESTVVLVKRGDKMADTIQSSRMYRHCWSFNAAITSCGVSTHISKWREVSLERNFLVLQSQTMETQLYLNCSCTTPSHPKGNMFIRHCEDKNDMLVIFLHIHC